MRVLWLAPYPPEAPYHGGRIRLLNLMRAVLARGHEVDLWCLDQKDEAAGVDALDASVRRFAPRSATKAVALLSRLPEEARSADTPALRRAIAGILPRAYDVAVLEQAHMGAHAALLANKGIPLVLDAQNVEAALQLQLSRHAKRVRHRTRLRVDASKLRRLEQRLFRDVRQVVAASSVDRDRILARAPEAEVAVVPNGVDTAYFGWHDHSRASGANLVMTGTLGYPPNLDAAMWLHDDVFPAIKKCVPSATVTLVGHGAPSELRRLHSPEDGFLVQGEVPDVRPFLRGADVFVLPMRLGRGIRLKSLEAIASGLPLVSTSLGVESVGLHEGRDVLLAETPEEFARQIVAAIGDGALRRTLVYEGRKTAVERFDWRRIGGDFVSVLESADRDPAVVGQTATFA